MKQSFNSKIIHMEIFELFTGFQLNYISMYEWNSCIQAVYFLLQIILGSGIQMKYILELSSVMLLIKFTWASTFLYL